MRFIITYMRRVQAEFDGPSADAAKRHADVIVGQFPKNEIIIHSIVADSYVEKPCEACAKPRAAVPTLLPHTGPGAA